MSKRAPIYAFDFKSDPGTAGWTFTASNNEGKQSYVADMGWYADKGGTLSGPRIKVTGNPWQFYRITFRGKSEVEGYYAVFFWDKDEKMLADDIYSSVYPSARWVDNDVVVRGREGAATFTVNFISRQQMPVCDLVVTPIAAAEAAACADKLYATLPPLDYTAPPARWALIPKTLAKLEQGGPLRVVMLGDSIINDTSNSNWDALVKRLYPKAEIRVITSVRGGTGCWHYRTDANFKSYVLDRKPDLLVIGGISNSDRDGVNGIESIREVIKKAREQIGCEILLMSGPVAADWRPQDPTNPDAPLPKQEPPPMAGLYVQMQALARELQVEYLDMHTPWHKYLGSSGKPWEWFHRDTVHADDRGKQVLARLIERYFAPKQ
jgi:hypothetical protein